MMFYKKEAAASYGKSACSFGSNGLLFDDMVPVDQSSREREVNFQLFQERNCSDCSVQFQRETILLTEATNK